MKIRFKKLDENAVMPTKAHATDAGYDLTAVSCFVDKNGVYVYGTGIAVEIPEGYVGLVFPRSSIADYNLVLSNCVGVIDSGYRGEIMAKFRQSVVHISKRGRAEIEIRPNAYQCGQRIAQLIILPVPEIEFEEVLSLSDSDRGVGGYGSSGK